VDSHKWRISPATATDLAAPVTVKNSPSATWIVREEVAAA
jgi:hypothetical protein